MALTVIQSWGVSTTLDFGEIVFNLVETGKLGKTDEDKKGDFANGYDFHEVFVKPFLPARDLERSDAARKKSPRAKKPPARKGN